MHRNEAGEMLRLRGHQMSMTFQGNFWLTQITPQSVTRGRIRRV